MQVRCPYGEARGSLVYCRVVGRTVNPLVMPCTSRRYERCRYYPKGEASREARRAEEQATGARGQGEVVIDPRESRRLLDPLETAKYLVAGRVARAVKLDFSGLDAVASIAAEVTGGDPDTCVLVVIDVGEEYLAKVCGSRVVGLASRSSVASPEELNGYVGRRATIIVYERG